MANMNLYYRTQLETKVSLLPEQIDGNIDDHILQNLRAKIEGKTIDNGIVLKITRLINYQNGLIDKANLMGTTVFKVTYECFICSPTKNLEIICKVDNDEVKGFLIASNGPVIVAIQYNNIDTQKFEISNNSIVSLKTKEPIQVDNYIKVSIINVNINLSESKITTIGKLIDLAKKDEIKSYQADNLLATGGQLDDDKIFI